MPLYEEKDMFGDPKTDPKKGVLSEKFIMPPFSVLNTRSGDWQNRKAKWLQLGLHNAVGITGLISGMNACSDLQQGGRVVAPGGSPLPAMNQAGHKPGDPLVRGDAKGRPMKHCYNIPMDVDYENGKGTEVEEGGTHGYSTRSVFDPVLCELAYSWWCPPGGQIIDPFAGTCVGGIVAGATGHPYWGCDLWAEQVEANRATAERINCEIKPQWVIGDSAQRLCESPEADMLWSCPPYGNLEVYSDKDEDISNMEWREFVVAYKDIIRKACDRLKPNRFVAWVIGEFRDKAGYYRNFLGGTVKAFKQCGLELYNEAILVTAVGSASVRATRQFEGGRKLVKTHQNVLVFVKGDWRKAADAVCGRA